MSHGIIMPGQDEAGLRQMCEALLAVEDICMSSAWPQNPVTQKVRNMLRNIPKQMDNQLQLYQVITLMRRRPESPRRRFRW